MASESSVILNIITKTEAALKQLSQFSQQSTKLLGKIEKQMSFVNQSASVFAGNLAAGAAIKGIEAIGAAFSGLADIVINDSVNAAEQYQDSLNQLQVSLELTGKASDSVLASFEEYAASIQETTKFSDDAVLSAAAYIQALGNLSDDGLKRATTAALDFASATGKDLAFAQEAVAKAATGNVTSLQKVGVEVRKGKTDAETFANALTALENKFGGSSLKTVNTFSGALAQARNAFDDVLKTIGNLVVKSPGVIGAIKGVSAVFTNISTLLGKEFAGQDPFKTLIVSALDFASTIVNVVVRPIVFLGDVFQTLVNVIRTGLQVGVATLATFADGWVKLAGLVGLADDSTVKFFENFKASSTETLTNFANQTADSFKDIGSQEFVDEINKSIETIKTSTQNQLTAIPGIANKAAADTKDALAPLSDVSIKIGLAVGDPEAIAANLAKIKEQVTTANQELKLSQDELRMAETNAVLEHQNALIEAQTQSRLNQLTFEQENGLSRLEISKQVVDEQISQAKRGSAEEAVLLKKRADLEFQLQQKRLGLASSFFGDLASLSRSGNKDLFEIGKAAALAQAVVDGAAAVQVALRAAPPPFNFLLAAAVGVKTAVNIATISAQTLANGTSFVSGGTAGVDSVPALLMPGERVISTPQNRDLTQFLNSGQDQKLDGVIEVLGSIFDRLGNLESTTVVNIGNREIVREVREGLRSGRQLVAT